MRLARSVLDRLRRIPLSAAIVLAGCAWLPAWLLMPRHRFLISVVAFAVVQAISSRTIVSGMTRMREAGVSTRVVTQGVPWLFVSWTIFYIAAIAGSFVVHSPWLALALLCWLAVTTLPAVKLYRELRRQMAEVVDEAG